MDKRIATPLWAKVVLCLLIAVSIIAVRTAYDGYRDSQLAEQSYCEFCNYFDAVDGAELNGQVGDKVAVPGFEKSVILSAGGHTEFVWLSPRKKNRVGISNSGVDFVLSGGPGTMSTYSTQDDERFWGASMKMLKKVPGDRCYWATYGEFETPDKAKILVNNACDGHLTYKLVPMRHHWEG